jgi:hypothetical protein
MAEKLHSERCTVVPPDVERICREPGDLVQADVGLCKLAAERVAVIQAAPAKACGALALLIGETRPAGLSPDFSVLHRFAGPGGRDYTTD